MEKHLLFMWNIRWEAYSRKHAFLFPMRRIKTFEQSMLKELVSSAAGHPCQTPYIFLCSWEFNSFWVVVTKKTSEKEINLEWWDVKSGWVCGWRHLARWNLLSENCQGSSSPSRAQKHVQASSACRQGDVNCFSQILLNLLACRSIKIAKLCTLPLGSNLPPAERNSCFNSCLCHRFALEPNYQLSLMTT